MFRRPPSLSSAGMLRRTAPWAAAFALVSTLAGALGAGATAQGTEEEQAATKAARGRITYRIYCTNCHGDSAKGDGRIAELLTVKPSDLTRLTGKGGSFDDDRVRKAIDGRAEVSGHGMREMPVWGDVFQEPEGTPEGIEKARGKIEDLVEYLKSIQAK